jgi:hypothetical protein
MLTKLDYTVPLELLEEARTQQFDGFRTPINEPTGRFFYDKWTIKEEYKNTVWDKIMSTLPMNVGEARVIVLDPAKCYQSHADIDDRYHLNIQNEMCYMLDFDNQQMHKIETDGTWYSMDTHRLHSASNFGRLYRIQLVVRQLLNDSVLTDPVSIKLTSQNLSKDDARFIFDRDISPWLNTANKQHLINDFKFSSNQVMFNVERSSIDSLKSKLNKDFYIEFL